VNSIEDSGGILSGQVLCQNRPLFSTTKAKIPQVAWLWAFCHPPSGCTRVRAERQILQQLDNGEKQQHKLTHLVKADGQPQAEEDQEVISEA